MRSPRSNPDTLYAWISNGRHFSNCIEEINNVVPFNIFFLLKWHCLPYICVIFAFFSVTFFVGTRLIIKFRKIVFSNLVYRIDLFTAKFYAFEVARISGKLKRNTEYPVSDNESQKVLRAFWGFFLPKRFSIRHLSDLRNIDDRVARNKSHSSEHPKYAYFFHVLLSSSSCLFFHSFTTELIYEEPIKNSTKFSFTFCPFSVLDPTCSRLLGINHSHLITFITVGLV